MSLQHFSFFHNFSLVSIWNTENVSCLLNVIGSNCMSAINWNLLISFLLYQVKPILLNIGVIQSTGPTYSFIEKHKWKFRKNKKFYGNMNCFHSFFEYSHTFMSSLIAQSLHQHPALVLVCVLHWSNTKHGCWHIFSHRVISPRLWVGWFCEELLFRGGAYCWKSSILMNKPFSPCLLCLVQPAMLSSYQMQHCVEKHSSVYTTTPTSVSSLMTFART